ncbi:sensor histidine kinase [Corynebacterium coyleae]|uniref:sensor histidine kinase n=1 Tax=Corynebacterium coyleae TaxID=53374 RepID=UPI00254B3657|nr:histidine kinase [Corynebacterium coyleae]MDK8663399.1 histidine kinase [Corynebacterium coyleae]MDK8706983.1 histidine kinase [Corynebacterium coyleae]MDK8733830.1 histidine kinase [Corynebacterium coyleae]MDK8892963.1 histidine kinase [Corynebacterium coyleae]
MRRHKHEERAATKIHQLTVSRRRIAEAYEVERLRIERDLHDGAQQYFVAAAMKLGEARLNIESQLLDDAARDLHNGLDALRRTVRGIHPRELSDHGLVAAIETAAAQHGPHVTVRAPHELPRIDASVTAAAYFFTTEALTNAAKHAPHAPVSVLVTCDHTLNVSVTDQGGGNARITPGGGLDGMRERIAAFSGEMELHSPDGGPTTVTARIPLLLFRGESGIAP